MKGKNVLQKWQIDFENFFNVYSAFLIDGYIDDYQPYVSDLEKELESSDVEEVGLCEYFERLFCEKEYHNQRNLLIIYDPTEAVGRRFEIKSRFVPAEPSEESENNEEKIYVDGEYPDSKLANHFYEILKSDSIENQLIDHSYAGASPDFAKIHYAISEEDRLQGYERVFKDFFDSFANLIASDSSQETNYVFVIKMISRLKANEDSKNLSNDELGIFRQLLAITNAISKTQHKLIILSDKNNELPNWFSDEMQNYNVKSLHVNRPNDEYKEFFFDKLVENEKFGSTFASQYNAQCVILPTDSEEVQSQKREAKRRLIKKYEVRTWKRKYSESLVRSSVIFLMNEEASGFVNGIVIPIDGAFNAYSGV